MTLERGSVKNESQRDVLRVHSSRCRLMPLYAALTAQVDVTPCACLDLRT